MKKPLVFGKYLLLDRVNVGGMAEVFVAKALGPEGFERYLAIKRILPTMAEDEEFIKMFIDEARISAQLSHPNIVHINELGKHEESYFIAMEYVAGRDLRSVLDKFRKRRRPMAISQAAWIVAKVCEGLDYAHRKKDVRGQSLEIIHRDVSPQNVLVSYEGEVKLIDFGIAKAANRSQKTQAGILKGKFGYMSPEQVRGLPIDRRTDLFAVGVMLFELLTNEKLFVGDSDYSILEKVRNAEIPGLSQFNPLVTPELERVVLKALAREPANRYQWADELREDLLQFIDADGETFSEATLASFMKETFGEEILKEAAKLKRFEELDLRSLSSDRLSKITSSQANSPALATLRDKAPMEVTDDSIVPLDESPEASHGRTSSARGKVIIGDGQAAHAGATTVAPLPPEEGPPESGANETRLLDFRFPEESQSPPKPLINPRRSKGPLGASLKRLGMILTGLFILGLFGAGFFYLLPRHPSGLVMVRVTPAHAELKWGTEILKQGVPRELPEGKHRLIATAEGFLEQSVDFWVRDGEQLEVQVELAPKEEPPPLIPEPLVRRVRVLFSVVPTTADVALDGLRLDENDGGGPLELTEGEAYLLTASATGFLPFESWWVVPSQQDPVTVSLALERLPTPERTRSRGKGARGAKVSSPAALGDLWCLTKPGGAQVWVDGRLTHRLTPINPADPLKLPVGRHKIVFKHAGKQSGPHVVLIREDEPSKLNVTLE